MEKTFKLPDGSIVKASLREKAEFKDPSKTYAGTILKASKAELGFFVSNREIYVFVNEEVFRLEDLSITNTLQDKKFLTREKRLFRILKSSREVLQEEYPASKEYDVNPFWPTEEEDVDDLLWFTQVLNRHERRLVMLETCTEAEKHDSITRPLDTDRG